MTHIFHRMWVFILSSSHTVVLAPQNLPVRGGKPPKALLPVRSFTASFFFIQPYVRPYHLIRFPPSDHASEGPVLPEPCALPESRLGIGHALLVQSLEVAGSSAFAGNSAFTGSVSPFPREKSFSFKPLCDLTCNHSKEIMKFRAPGGSD
jgi:hypothetical protein